MTAAEYSEHKLRVRERCTALLDWPASFGDLESDFVTGWAVDCSPAQFAATPAEALVADWEGLLRVLRGSEHVNFVPRTAD